MNFPLYINIWSVLNESETVLFICILILAKIKISFYTLSTLLRCKYHFSFIFLRSIPVVVIPCEENEIYQLDFRIERDNIRCFILLSGLRKFVIFSNTCYLKLLMIMDLKQYAWLCFVLGKETQYLFKFQIYLKIIIR